MIVTNTAYTGASAGAGAQPAGRGMDELGQADFLKLLTVQMQQQDPFDPVDNKDMLAQMAQFSALAGSADTNATLEQISEKLDRLIDVSMAASSTTPTE